MADKNIICECKQNFNEEQFSKHFSSCKDFKLTFNDFDSKFSFLLKQFSEPKERLVIVRFLLKQYLNVIEQKISKLFSPEPMKKNLSFNRINLKDSIIFCQRCKVNPDIIYLPCLHQICINCFTLYAEQNFYDMKCNKCQQKIDEETKLTILGQEKYKEIEKSSLNILFQGLKKCPYENCGEFNEFVEGNVDYNIVDEQNKKISKEAAEDYAKHRCRCGFCKKDFCIQCSTKPYHLGKTCEEFKIYVVAKRCRFCDNKIKDNNKGPSDDVCNEKECIERFKISCKKKLHCGHRCFGVEGEKICPPCIDNECKEYKGEFDQNKDTYCVICYSEGLGSSPIAVLSCGHYVHYTCIKKRLENKWIGPRITFNHCLCPSCNKWYDCKSLPDIQKLIDGYKKLYEELKDMAVKRLKFEGLDKDDRLSDKNSPWYGKTEEFAMKRLSYYMCYVCKKPYFAGRKECGNDPGMDNDNPNVQFKEEDCVCGKDANISGIPGITNCSKHGKEFIEYKCKFCCKIASWFCWNTTHFCEDCHKRQNAGDYIASYSQDKLPKCNKSTCEVGGNHPPNGTEYALGCSICRNMEENAKNF